jgi:hypothetical protein
MRHGSDIMKAAKVVLAILLGAGAVAAYWYFPNPLEDAAEQVQGAEPAHTEPPPPAAGAEAA